MKRLVTLAAVLSLGACASTDPQATGDTNDNNNVPRVTAAEYSIDANAANLVSGTLRTLGRDVPFNIDSGFEYAVTELNGKKYRSYGGRYDTTIPYQGKQTDVSAQVIFTAPVGDLTTGPKDCQGADTNYALSMRFFIPGSDQPGLNYTSAALDPSGEQDCQFLVKVNAFDEVHIQIDEASMILLADLKEDQFLKVKGVDAHFYLVPPS